jgi:hypothetical protein
MSKSQIRQYVFTPGIANNGTIKIPGKVDLSQLLVITNTSTNTILYNFADNAYSGTQVSFTRANDSVNFPTTLDNTDGYTTITLAIDTSGMSSAHNIQVFIEKPYLDVRMPEIGTDAFERTRVATPTSMLDADFEYGLQPTKWLTYDLMRGYPSIYEIPGTDQAVLSVITDASTGSGGIGESLITVTVSSPFSSAWTVGSPITIKGYLNTVSGFARAEGSFLINSISGSTLTYYAKAKVGVNNGDILSTVYTQLRQGAFYTGASVGTPSYSYVNTSSAATSSAATIATTSGTITGGITGTALITSGGSPAVGMVLSGGNIIPGTYIVSGSATTWVVSTTQTTTTSPGTTISYTQTTLTTGGTITGTWAIGQVVSGSTTLTGTAIIALGTGTGNNVGGTYYVDDVQTVSSFAASGTTGLATITATFSNNHGFVPGDTILSQVSSDATGNNHSLAQGPFFIETIPTFNTFTFSARNSGLISGSITGAMYARPDAFFSHRPFDGGVILGNGSPSHGAMAVRMSKKYIRYQSGKAINYNTGALFAPNYDIRSLTATGTAIGQTITIATDDVDHGCQVGATIVVTGVTTSGYNGTYTVASIIDERQLTVLATQVLGATTAAISSPCLMSVSGWSGATVRAGTFDEQNGTFWQYDGQTIAIGRRSSTFQLAGTVTVTVDSNSVVGSNTRFASQLIAGDRVVIRGMTHVVTTVTSDTQIYVTPDYRGAVSGTGIKMVRTTDYIIPQSKWNTDRCDGSGSVYNPSGYNITINKMQMIGLQWTWYGAGFTDWMIRGPEGKYITVHRLRGNNLNNEAYMRSGNQPVRYEVVNESARTYLTLAALSGDTSLTVADTTYFPNAGTVYVDNEVITYTGKTATTLTGCTRGTSLTQFTAGASRSFAGGSSAGHALNAGVILIGQTATPSISHWGSAFLTDGGFDSDRGYIFNYQATNINISARKTTAFAIRLAPSVSNAIIGDLGVRELINRAQLLLQGIEITAGGTSNTNSAIVIEGVLNPSNYPVNVANITWNSLSSPALPTGQPSFSQIANGTSVTFQGQATNVTTNVTGAYTNSNAGGVTTLALTSVSGLAVGDDVYVPAAPSAVYGATKLTAVGTASFTATITSTVSGGTAVTAATSTISGTTLTLGAAASGTIVTGMVVTGSGVAAGTYVIGNLSGGTAAGSTWAVSVSQTVASTTLTFTPYIATIAGTLVGYVYIGSLLTGGTVTAGTYIIAQATGTVGGLGTYYVSQGYTGSPTGATINYATFNNPIPLPWASGTSIQFSRNTYALPGETVFSFVSSPANKDALDLSPLKELTNTPIGGRGTFPNGPDVLFINVYITQGNPVNSNLVLRWGEAQA